MSYHAICSGSDLDRKPVVSVVLVMRHRVSGDGACTWEGEEVEPCVEPVEYPDLETPALRRDVDPYAWRSFTDVVVQGTVRAERPVTSLGVELSCEGSGASFKRALVVSGDRRVERGAGGLRLSDPAPFTEMPLRYDRAYGGADLLADQRHVPGGAHDFLREHFDVQGSPSLVTYPRNPAGRGYLTEADGADGLAWPNVQWADDLLQLDRLCAPHLDWGDRPYPAGFDWFHHTWFPRCAFMALAPPTRDKAMPPREVELGILERDLLQRPLLQRLGHGFSQGAHPYLWRHRLLGDETLRVNAMSADGRDSVVRLQPYHPRVHITQPARPEAEAPVVLDCVFWETDEKRVTLVWRGSLPAAHPGTVAGWEERCSYRVGW